MYKSPIEIFESPIHDVIQQMNEEKENYIYQCVADIGVNIDKEELLRALQYDREQYEQGYRDGIQANKWISANERLPESKMNYIVRYIHSYSDDDGYYAIGVVFYDGQGFNLFDRAYKVTHWMPLPKPPKED